MTRFRKWLIALVVAAALAVPLASVASADPGDPGGVGPSVTTTTHGPRVITWTAAAADEDPGDPGGVGP